MPSQPPANDPAANQESGAELRLGYALGRMGNPGGYRKDRPAKYAYAGEPQQGVFYARGCWIARADYLESCGEGENSILIKYSAATAGMLMAPAGGVITNVCLRQDNAPLQAGNDTADTRPPSGEAEEESHVRVDRLRMYALVDNREPGTHVLELICRTPGLRIYACAFSGLRQSQERQSPAA